MALGDVALRGRWQQLGSAERGMFPCWVCVLDCRWPSLSLHGMSSAGMVRTHREIPALISAFRRELKLFCTVNE